MDNSNDHPPADQREGDPMSSETPHANNQADEESSDSSWDSRRLCGAKTRDGGTCRQLAMPNGRCRLHGGKSRCGTASPKFKHGFFSAYLPKGLASNYRRVLSDPELLNMREEVALLRAMIGERLEIMSSGGPTKQTWAELQRLQERLEAARSSGDNDESEALIQKIDATIQAGGSTSDHYSEIVDLIMTKSNIADRERKRLDALRGTISVERAMILVAAIVEVIKQNVADSRVMAAISHDIGNLIVADESPDKPTASDESSEAEEQEGQEQSPRPTATDF